MRRNNRAPREMTRAEVIPDFWKFHSKLRYTQPQTAYFLGVSVPTVKKLIENGHLRAWHEGSRVFIPGSSIVDYCTMVDEHASIGNSAQLVVNAVGD